ncbi:MAG TPA: S-layer homology domain-containing protein, partial [Clostridiales bacterium]|nr:S-layer homology domain-containing protein [Clostridiales bacterium]
MKNLKKALVLVLAFAMVFSLFTFNASAASFADDDEIVNKEAVATMSQLGIINGYEDGTFLPKQVVTRAEMCKMISVAMTGGNLPLLEGTSLFSDTAGHWANSYINYCYNKGIVSGDAGKGGAFRPDAAVTGLEAAKMMLVALGYNPAIAGFT